MAPRRRYKQDPTALEETLRKRLRRARERKGLTPEALDQLIGEKTGLIRRLEAGRASLHLSRIYAICGVLTVDIDHLFADLHDYDPEPLDRDPGGPSVREAETFIRHYSGLKQTSHRRDLSELVRSVAKSLDPKPD